jgi:uncharacterized protein
MLTESAAPHKLKTAIATPVIQKERIAIIDSLRGIAILGILLMNIGGMALPYNSDPSIMNETGNAYRAWYFMTWFADGTQRALFSLLFGAGIILFIGNKSKSLDGFQTSDVFFRRQLWLVVFGLFNIYVLLWSGDILFDYGCYGMIMFVFRNWSPKSLIAASIVCTLLMIARENRDLYLDKAVINKGEAIALRDTSVNKLSILEKEELNEMIDFKESASQDAKKIRAEKAIAKMNNRYNWIYTYRTESYVHSFVRYTYFSIWDVIQFMFLGMAFYKTGTLMGKSRTVVYALMCLIGLGIGLAMSWMRTDNFISNHFNWFEYTKNVGFEFYNLDRTFRAIGIFGGIMLLYKSGVFKWFFAIFRPVGQMAFTNYLLQSATALVLFTGIGFGLFGKLDRFQLYMIVGQIWIVQIIMSHIWLRYFRFGPFEWLWRSLTYWKKQPMNKER